MGWWQAARDFDRVLLTRHWFQTSNRTNVEIHCYDVHTYGRRVVHVNYAALKARTTQLYQNKASFDFIDNTSRNVMI